MKKKLFQICLLVALLAQGCRSSTPISNSPTEAPLIPTETSVVSTQLETKMPPIVEPTAIQIQHTILPSQGTTDRATSHDNENILSFQTKKVKSGDDFIRNRFERPFTSVDMEYLPDIDIMDFSINSDDNFFYIKISFVGLDPDTQTLTGFYGIEIDRDVDGRSEILLATKPPYTDHFSADNTIMYLDLNGDVGGSRPNRPDDFPGNGYDAIVFDLSQKIYPEGDPDLVWVRKTTLGKHPAIEIAYRKWIFEGGKEAFMWNVLSSDVRIDSSLLYYHDNYTAAQAGAANPEDPNYPIKDLAGVDNTCRVPFGFEATGKEPLACFISGSEIVHDGEPENAVTSVGDIGNSQGCQRFPEVCSRSLDSIRLVP